MNTKPLRRRSYVHALLMAMAMGGIGAGCGEAEPIAERASALDSCRGGARNFGPKSTRFRSPSARCDAGEAERRNCRWVRRGARGGVHSIGGMPS